MEKNKFLFSQPTPIKLLITCFVLSLLMGYVIAILQIYNRTQFDVGHTIQYYRGVESANELEAIPGPSFATLLSVAHVHTLSQPVMLALMGLLFAMSYVTTKAKSLFIVLSFLCSWISNLSPFLIRYISKNFSILLPLSQMMLMLSFFIMAFVVLYDVWVGPVED